ncbi:MAG: M12 family metallo-peptidase [Phycisphaerales bacterium]|jgi:hypothetical protein
MPQQARIRPSRILAAFATTAAACLARPALQPALEVDATIQSGTRDHILSLDATRWQDAWERSLTTRVAGVPLADGERVDLVLEPFRIVAPGAKILVVDHAGEREASLDDGSITFWRGHVEGLHGSHVFLSIAESSIVGRIELGAGRPTYGISSKGGDPAAGGVALGQGQAVVYRANRTTDRQTSPVLCGTHAGIQPDAPNTGAWTPSVPAPTGGVRRARLAVDSDYEFFELFENERAALVYLTQAYAMVSDLTVRDVGVRLDLIYLRLWTTPDDPYGISATFPDLSDAPQYDIGQLMSGSKFASAGGAARVCARASWVAYATGEFDGPITGSVLNQDVRIAAHEVGHNLGALHPHNYGVDQCDDPATRPRRGTLLSYCSQTFSGGTKLTDPHFHTRIREVIAGCVPDRLPFDCNGNGIDDLLDIDAGASLDANANGVPDECEDCNANGVLDSIDIDSGTSNDANGNGIPDECEPDCNGNGLPDDLDIAANSLDRNGDGIPDECQADRDGDGVADWTNIYDDMARDIDRDGVLDETQDCDGDGIMDIDAIDHAHNIWAVSSGDAKIKEYHFGSGVLRAESRQNRLQDPIDVLVSLDRRVLVTDAGFGGVAEFDRAGTWMRWLVEPGSGGLVYPTALAISPEGDLLVADRDGNSVLRYDADTGAFLGVFVEPMSGGLMAPYGITIGPDDNLFVNTDHAGVLEFDGRTGAFVRTVVEHGAAGLHHGRGILFIPRPVELGPGWRLLVASGEEHNVLEFDPDTGDFVGVFNEGDFRGKLRDPWGLRQGPDGSVFVSSANAHPRLPPPASGSPGPTTAGLHLTRPHIFQYDGRSGKLVRAYVQGIDSQLDHPKGFDFVPGPLDRNLNGIPDSCEATCPADCDGSGSIDLLDFLCFQNAFAAGDAKADCNGDGSLDIFDFLCFQRAFDIGCP